MTMNTLPKFVDTIRTGAVDVVAALTKYDIAVAGANGSAIEFLSIVSTQTAANTVTLYVENTAAATFKLGSINVPLLSGIDGAAAVDGLNATDLPFLPKNAFTDPVLHLQAGFTLQAEIPTLATTGIFTCMASIRDY